MKKSRDCKCRMPVETFVHAVVEAHVRGETIAELAVRLGRKPATVYIRLCELRHAGVALPKLPAAHRLTVVERAKKALASARRMVRAN